jgi:hypothetical protein
VDTSTGYGTLDLILSHKQDLFGLTAGHVLEGRERTFTITHRVTQYQATATPVIQPSDASTGFVPEVGLIKVHRNDRRLLDARASRFDMYAFNKITPPRQNTETGAMNFDCSTIRSTALYSAMTTDLPVFKDGGHTW